MGGVRGIRKVWGTLYSALKKASTSFHNAFEGLNLGKGTLKRLQKAWVKAQNPRTWPLNKRFLTFKDWIHRIRKRSHAVGLLCLSSATKCMLCSLSLTLCKGSWHALSPRPLTSFSPEPKAFNQTLLCIPGLITTRSLDQNITRPTTQRPLPIKCFLHFRKNPEHRLLITINQLI